MIDNPHSIFNLIKSIHKMKKPPQLKCLTSIAKSTNSLSNKQRLYRNSSIGAYNINLNRDNNIRQLPSLTVKREKSRSVCTKAKNFIRYSSILSNNKGNSNNNIPFEDDDSSSNIQPIMIDDKIDFIKTHLQLKPSHYSRNKRVKVTGGNIHLEDIAEDVKTSSRTRLVGRNGLVFYVFNKSKPSLIEEQEVSKTCSLSDLRNHPKTIELIKKFKYRNMKHSKLSTDDCFRGDDRLYLNNKRTYRNLQCILYKREKYHQEGMIIEGYK